MGGPQEYKRAGQCPGAPCLGRRRRHTTRAAAATAAAEILAAAAAARSAQPSAGTKEQPRPTSLEGASPDNENSATADRWTSAPLAMAMDRILNRIPLSGGRARARLSPVAPDAAAAAAAAAAASPAHRRNRCGARLKLIAQVHRCAECTPAAQSGRARSLARSIISPDNPNEQQRKL